MTDIIRDIAKRLYDRNPIVAGNRSALTYDELCVMAKAGIATDMHRRLNDEAEAIVDAVQSYINAAPAPELTREDAIAMGLIIDPEHRPDFKRFNVGDRVKWTATDGHTGTGWIKSVDVDVLGRRNRRDTYTIRLASGGVIYPFPANALELIEPAPPKHAPAGTSTVEPLKVGDRVLVSNRYAGEIVALTDMNAATMDPGLIWVKVKADRPGKPRVTAHRGFRVERMRTGDYITPPVRLSFPQIAGRFNRW